MIDGFATPEGTAAYARSLGASAVPDHFRRFADLTLSSLGIGTYLGDADAVTDRGYTDAVSQAIRLGVNVVDSAINYRHQRSERSIGAAFKSLLAAGVVARDQVLVATKGGFIPYDGEAPANAGAYIARTYVRPGIIRPEELVGNSHCMAPRYLADQLERSRRNLDVGTIDVYYLHNPEFQLSAVDRPTFLARMQAAFEFLERAVADGQIRLYGTATWTGYRQSPSAGGFLSLSELAGLATRVAGSAHHFRVIQLPYNLAMSEAFTQPNQSIGRETVTVLEAARRLDIYTMTSAPIYQGQLARALPPVLARVLPGLTTDAQRALQFVRSTPGVGTALVGMRQAGHVEENARVAAVAPAPWEQFGQLFQKA